jgi:hypothetical protein
MSLYAISSGAPSTMKLLRRILVTLLGIVGALPLAFAVYVASYQDLRYDVRAPHIPARTDSACAA